MDLAARRTTDALSYPQIRELLAGERLPAAFVDLGAFDRNVARVAAMVARQNTPLRVASKSVRVVELIRRALDRAAGAFVGVMCYAVEEAEHLADAGFDDLLVAYPAWQSTDLERAARLAARGVLIRLVADSARAIDRIAAAARAARTELRVVLCVDMSLRLAAGRVHLGVRRSPLREADEVVKLARHATQSGARFGGLMGYEAQVAGMGDANPFQPLANPIKAWIRRASAAELGARRSRIVAALRDAGLAPEIVNGGGTGSLDSTTPATGVTEVTAGSAFFKPLLFDYYDSPHMRALEPAAFFALEVTRKPRHDMVTCLGGGYVASGAAGPDKVPRPWLPAGLELLPDEMCGEVQTPLKLADPGALDLGDPVIFRHAKGGELFERFREVLLIEAGKIARRVNTYRGEGMCFF